MGIWSAHLYGNDTTTDLMYENGKYYATKKEK